MHTSLLPCAGPTCTWQRRALTKPNLNVGLLKHPPCCPHFPAVTHLLESDGSRWTFSLEFKFLILHFWVQLDIFTVYFKIQRLPTQLYYDHSEYGIYYSQCCTSNQRRAASIPQLGKNWKVFHFSILLSFSHNLFQLGRREFPVSDGRKCGKRSFPPKQEARAELSFSNLAVCVALTFLPKWGKPLALKS